MLIKFSYPSLNFQSILNNYPNLYRNSGIAFWTETNFRLYLEYLKTTYPDKERFELILNRIIIGRKLRVQFYSLVAAVASISLAVLCSVEGHYLWSAIMGCMFFIGLKLALNALEIDNTNAFSTINQLRLWKQTRQTKNTKKITTTINGQVFNLSQKEILIIEYFKFLTKEGKNLINFGNGKNPVNKEVILTKLKRNWGTAKKSTVQKQLAVGIDEKFNFLKNIRQNRIDYINSYFVAAEFFDARKIFSDVMLK